MSAKICDRLHHFCEETSLRNKVDNQSINKSIFLGQLTSCCTEAFCVWSIFCLTLLIASGEFNERKNKIVFRDFTREFLQNFLVVVRHERFIHQSILVFFTTFNNLISFKYCLISTQFYFKFCLIFLQHSFFTPHKEY